ncbi:MAG: heme o synthase [Halobacteriales archaeon]
MADASTRTTTLIAAATMGVYVLIMAGATTAIADATAACSGWPTCNGGLLPGGETDQLIAWSHRVIALIVGGLVLAAGVAGIRSSEDRRVRSALAIALLLYPVQVALGALTVTQGPSTTLSAIHLAAGVGIFGGFLLSLAWLLEGDDADEPGEDLDSNPDDPASTPDGATEPVDAVDGEPYEPPTTARGRLIGTVRAYVSLTKPRLMWLLCLVAAAGMALSAGQDLGFRTVVLTLTGGVLAIGASGTFNHVLERDVDRRMQRTADRPLATDQVGVRNAVLFGIVLAIGSVATFLSINGFAAVLGAAAIAYYSVVYTLILKPNTVQNTVIGGLAGSFPAAIGAAAATNTVGPAALLLAAVIFLWTPAHFYNLALAYKEDYERGGFPMMPVVRGEATTRKHILLYLGATLIAAAALAAVSGLGPLYSGTSVALGTVFLWMVLKLHRNPGERAAFRAFHASNAYLGALLLAIVVDALAV